MLIKHNKMIIPYLSTLFSEKYSYLCTRKTSNGLIFCLVMRVTYMGKSCTASSLGILQDGNVAKVLGCSGAM